MPEISSKLITVIKSLSKKASETLSTSKYLNDGAFTKDEILSLIKKSRRGIGGAFTKEGKQAVSALDNVYAQAEKKLRNTVSQSNVDDIIGKIDNEINWDKFWKAPETVTAEEKAMVRLRGVLSDSLKSKNKSYGEVMKPLSEAIETKKQFFSKVKPDFIRGDGVKTYMPSDRTVPVLRALGKEGKYGTRRALEGVEKYGSNIVNPVEDALAREAVENASINLPVLGRIGTSYPLRVAVGMRRFLK